MKKLQPFGLAWALWSAGCVSPLAPASAVETTAVAAPVVTPAAPVAQSPLWVLSGQSNAVQVAPFLAPYGPLAVEAQSNTPLWAWAAPDARLWPELQPLLHQPLTAFIWWQGENDAQDPAGYEVQLPIFIGRVRTEAGNPTLRVVICGANSAPGQDALRAVQQRVAGSLGNAVFVRSDDLPADGPHLTGEGYAVMAGRIAAAAGR